MADFQLNAAIPMSYQYGPSPVEQLSQIVTLADAMDKRRMNKMALSAAEKKQKEEELLAQDYAKKLRGYTTTQTPGFVGPMPEGSAMYTPAPEAPIAPQPGPEVTQPADVFGQIQGSTVPLPILARSLKAQYGFDLTPEQLAIVQQKDLPGTTGTGTSLEQFQQMPAIQGMAQKAAQAQTQGQAQQADYARAQEAYPQAQADYARTQAAQTPEARLPEEYAWMKPQEYETYLKRGSINPALGEAYLDKLIDIKSKQATTTKTLAEAGAAEAKSKSLEDYQAGSILSSLPETASSDEKTQALIGAGWDQYSARAKADDPGVMTRFKNSQPELAKAKIQAEKEQKSQEMAIKQQDAARKEKESQLDSKLKRLQIEKLVESNTMTRDKATAYAEEKSRAMSSLSDDAQKILNNPKFDEYTGSDPTSAARRAYLRAIGDQDFKDFETRLTRTKNLKAFESLQKLTGAKSDFDVQFSVKTTGIDIGSPQLTREILQGQVDYYQNTYLTGNSLVPQPAIKSKAETPTAEPAQSVIKPKGKTVMVGGFEVEVK